MQLYLVQNDPLDTLLVSADGEPLYSIRTSASTPSSADVSPLSLGPDSSSSSTPSSFGFPDVSDVTPASSASSHSFFSSSYKSTRPPLARQFAGLPETISQQKHRQPPMNAHPAIPISRTHSNPHPHHHGQYPDPSSPQPSPAIPHKTPSAHLLRPGPILPSAGPSSSSSPVTLVKRLERHTLNRGNVETEIGKIDHPNEDAGIRVLLCNTGVELCAPNVPNRTQKAQPHPPPTLQSEASSLSRRNDTGTALDAFRDFCLESQSRKANTTPSSPAPVDELHDNDHQEFIPDPTWSLNDPADRPFKWLSLASCPVLVHDTQPTPTPVARYRPAKLGIVSRSRRGFLEILPAGLELENWIVVTFVAYFRMKLGEDACRSRGGRPHGPHEIHESSPISSMVVDRSAHTPAASLSAPATPSIRPQHYSPPRLPFPPLPSAYLGALRRKGKHYDAPQPRW